MQVFLGGLLYWAYIEETNGGHLNSHIWKISRFEPWMIEQPADIINKDGVVYLHVSFRFTAASHLEVGYPLCQNNQSFSDYPLMVALESKMQNDFITTVLVRVYPGPSSHFFPGELSGQKHTQLSGSFWFDEMGPSCPLMASPEMYDSEEHPAQLLLFQYRAIKSSSSDHNHIQLKTSPGSVVLSWSSQRRSTFRFCPQLLCIMAHRSHRVEVNGEQQIVLLFLSCHAVISTYVKSKYIIGC